MHSSNIALDDKLFNNVLEKDFDPNEYDKMMDEQFGADYYEHDDENDQELEGSLYFCFVMINLRKYMLHLLHFPVLCLLLISSLIQL